jgi:hypothetical protein
LFGWDRAARRRPLGLGPDPTATRWFASPVQIEAADRIARFADRPVMLDFEDVQAGEISLEIVGSWRAGHLIYRAAGGRVPREDLPPGAFFREWRARLIAQRTAEEARLAPLNRDQTALMTTLILDTGLPAPREVVDAVYRRTDGIPLHVEELLGALSEEAKTDGRAIRDATVPDTIEDAILARLAQLSPEAREVARAGAVIGRCFIPSCAGSWIGRSATSMVARGAAEPVFLYEQIELRRLRHRCRATSTGPSGRRARRLHARAGSSARPRGQSRTTPPLRAAGLRGQALAPLARRGEPNVGPPGVVRPLSSGRLQPARRPAARGPGRAVRRVLGGGGGDRAPRRGAVGQPAGS